MNFKKLIQKPIAALDIGSSKISCLLAQTLPIGNDGAPTLSVLGMGLAQAKGIHRGKITHMEELKQSIRQAVYEAEKTSGQSIQKLWLNVENEKVCSRYTENQVRLTSSMVTSDDLVAILNGAARELVNTTTGHQDRFHILDYHVLEYRLDDQYHIADPLGMKGHCLYAKIHFLTIPVGVLDHLRHLMDLCDLEVEGFMFSPQASGYAAMTEQEKKQNVLIVDMGAHSTQLAWMCQQGLIYADVIPVGGQHVTHDLSQVLSIPIRQADRIKILYGSAIYSLNDSTETIDIQSIDGADEDFDHPSVVSKTWVVNVIRPRIEEIFELIKQSLDKASQHPIVQGKRFQKIILTGGGSELYGTTEVAQKILGCEVRKSGPSGLLGSFQEILNPSLSTCSGILQGVNSKKIKKPLIYVKNASDSSTMFGRMLYWLRDNF